MIRLIECQEERKCVARLFIVFSAAFNLYRPPLLLAAASSTGGSKEVYMLDESRTSKERLQGIMPTNYFVASLALSIVLHFAYPIGKVLHPPATYAGYLLIGFGAAMNLWTDALFKKHDTTVKPYLDPSTLIVSGSFALSRHPMYLGMASVLLGVAVIHGTIVTFLFPVAYVALMELLFIPYEEEICVKVFGDAYLEYRRRVRRWL